MAIPTRIPECSNHKVDACPKSDVICVDEKGGPNHDAAVFYCRTCKGVQIYTPERRRPQPAPRSF